MLRCAELAAGSLERLLARFDLEVRWVEEREPIPGSYWGEPEAGLAARSLFVRGDTPVHSALHEASHAICMGPARRQCLDTDAGGDDFEESAVCYLQLLLADELAETCRVRLAADMDAWGYSFRLGSTLAWLESDAEDAREWLLRRGLLTARGALVEATAAEVR